MRIIHTSDWHLGKNLEGFSRLDEQETFLDEFVNIVDENAIDMVIIAGDIYDNGNPPARAEKLFYSTLRRLSKDGKRAVLVIAGNHDNPERLAAASPLAFEHGVILLGTPKSCAEVGHYGGFDIVEAGEGYVEMDIARERAVIITLPYPSEKRLSEILAGSIDEEDMRKGYSERIGEIFTSLSKRYREDTVNLAVSHLFITGGVETDSERPIQLGGSYAVDECCLPGTAQYIALGHLHKPQRISKRVNAYYAGSPLQYSKSEINYSKCAYIVDVKPGTEPDIKEVYFKNYKPIEVAKCNNIEEAVQWCRENSGRSLWAYIEIKTDRVLAQSEIKEMKEYIPDIIEIKPIISGGDDGAREGMDNRERGMEELFREFYSSSKGVEVSRELMELFLNITKEEGDLDEAQEA